MGLTDILVPGNYFCDLIFTSLPDFPKLGTEIYTGDMTVVPGGVLNTVVGLQRLGVSVGWAGAVGNDFFSRYILDWIQAEGIDMGLIARSDDSLRRVTVALSYPQDRAFVTYVDPAPDLVSMTLAALEHIECRHLHFHKLVIDERMPDLLRLCRERGIFVSMDCQYREDTLEIPLLRAILSQIDLFMPNAGEAQRLTMTDNLSAAAERLTTLVGYLVVKDGANGAHAWRNGLYFHAPALSLTPLDTTGAGDVFNAGFLAAHLAGYDIATCLRWGNISGGLSTQGYGGCSNAPTRAQLEAML
jgi:sugar/nucleoside kinase (ribokinase family)